MAMNYCGKNVLLLLVLVLSDYGVNGLQKMKDDDSNPCLDLTGITTIFGSGNDVLSVVETNYITSPVGINFTATGLLLLPNGSFDISPEGFGPSCSGNLAKTCSFLIYGSGDLQTGIYLSSFYDSGYPVAWEQFINRIIRKNGFLMMDQSRPFTPDNLCISDVPPTNYYGSHSQVSLCCSRFQQPLKAAVMEKHQNIRKDAKTKINKIAKKVFDNKKI